MLAVHGSWLAPELRQTVSSVNGKLDVGRRDFTVVCSLQLLLDSTTRLSQ